MNILRHKSWHVLRKENKAKVRADEAKAGVVDMEKQRKSALSDKEQKLQILRNGSFSQKSKQDGKMINSRQLQSLFSDPNELSTSKLSNPDLDREKKEKQKKYEQAIGLYYCLGQSLTDAKDGAMWYTKNERPNAKEIDEEKLDEKSKKRKLLDNERKTNEDPMSSLMSQQREEEIDRQRKAEEMEKVKGQKRFKLSSGNNDNNNSKQSIRDELEKLRQERLERESTERKREIDVMRRAQGLPPRPETPPTCRTADLETTDERLLPYNSAFEKTKKSKKSTFRIKRQDDFVRDFF